MRFSVSKLITILVCVVSQISFLFLNYQPAKAGESEAGSEAGLEANIIPRGRRRGRRWASNQQQLQANQLQSFVTNAPRNNGMNRQRPPHLAIKNYGRHHSMHNGNGATYNANNGNTQKYGALNLGLGSSPGLTSVQTSTP